MPERIIRKRPAEERHVGPLETNDRGTKVFPRHHAFGHTASTDTKTKTTIANLLWSGPGSCEGGCGSAAYDHMLKRLSSIPHARRSSRPMHQKGPERGGCVMAWNSRRTSHVKLRYGGWGFAALIATAGDPGQCRVKWPASVPPRAGEDDIAMQLDWPWLAGWVSSTFSRVDL